jgi:chromate transport protein ChrA
VATIALFAPAAVLMFFISHFYKRLRKVRAVQDLLAGITPTVVGMVGSAAISLAPGSLHLNRPLGGLLCAVSLLLLIRWQWHPAFVLLIGVVSGLLLPTFI